MHANKRWKKETESIRLQKTSIENFRNFYRIVLLCEMPNNPRIEYKGYSSGQKLRS